MLRIKISVEYCQNKMSFNQVLFQTPAFRKQTIHKQQKGYIEGKEQITRTTILSRVLKQQKKASFERQGGSNHSSTTLNYKDSEHSLRTPRNNSNKLRDNTSKDLSAVMVVNSKQMPGNSPSPRTMSQFHPQNKVGSVVLLSHTPVIKEETNSSPESPFIKAPSTEQQFQKNSIRAFTIDFPHPQVDQTMINERKSALRVKRLPAAQKAAMAIKRRESSVIEEGSERMSSFVVMKSGAGVLVSDNQRQTDINARSKSLSDELDDQLLKDQFKETPDEPAQLIPLMNQREEGKKVFLMTHNNITLPSINHNRASLPNISATQVKTQSPYSSIMVIPPNQSITAGLSQFKKPTNLKRVQVQFKNKIIQIQREQHNPDLLQQSVQTGKESYQAKHYLNSFKASKNLLENSLQASSSGRHVKNMSYSQGRTSSTKIPVAMLIKNINNQQNQYLFDQNETPYLHRGNRFSTSMLNEGNAHGSTSVGDSLELGSNLKMSGQYKVFNQPQMMLMDSNRHQSTSDFDNELATLSFTRSKVLTKRKNKSVMEHLPGWQQSTMVPMSSQDTATEQDFKDALKRIQLPQVLPSSMYLNQLLPPPSNQYLIVKPATHENRGEEFQLVLQPTGVGQRKKQHY
ncbi:hypothetical protein FGO68_gene2991 [Halteria grandinella]|uniref:Uncharacterized protein n=1 Tax=Halteria grandinella TaxID=5974 RepID=A0A8J8NVF4_HALGN|nr:hypothetical protein FGO68_gene2991 [Halteria grandinella]